MVIVSRPKALTATRPARQELHQLSGVNRVRRVLDAFSALLTAVLLLLQPFELPASR
jgi:hypothetical protein